MVNLQQLETFTNSNFSTSIKASGAGTYGYGQGSIAYAGSKNTAEQVRWVNGNNFLINVKAVRIKPGTDWSKGSQNWKGERTWKAAATMIYEYEVYGR